MTSTTLKMNDQGRVSIPAPVRRELGFTPDVDLIGYVEKGRFVVESREHSKTRVRQLAAAARTGRGSMVDELIAERRAAAQDEAKEMGWGTA